MSIKTSNQSTKLSNEEIKNLIELEKKATKAPWDYTDNTLDFSDSGGIWFQSNNPMIGDSSNDTKFISTIRNTAPYLLAEVLELREILKSLPEFSCGCHQCETHERIANL